MTISAAALQELHRLHRQRTDLRERLQRGPKQVRAAETNVQRLQEAQEQAKRAYTKTRMASDDKQLQLKQRETHIADLQSKLNRCSSNKEYQMLVEQIAADKQANSVLEDEILETLERVEQLQAAVGEAEATLGKAREEADKTRQRVVAEQTGLESELARVNGLLAEAEKALPADFKSDYDRVAKSRGENALAEVEDDCCGGCYQVLSPQTMNLLYLSKPVFCKSCGALLYLPEDRSVGSSS